MGGQRELHLRYDNEGQLATGLGKYEHLRESHWEWVEAALKEKSHCREEMWTQNIAVSSRDFTETTKEALGVLANGRKLREPPSLYEHDFAGEKEGLSEGNTYYWG